MKINRLLLTLVAAMAAAGLWAQSVVTPYSRFGYGMLSDNATSTQRSMGGVGYAMNNGRQINVMNPASYAMMDSLTFLFDMGIDLSQVWQQEQQANVLAKHDQFGGGLDYITMQAPLSKTVGASLGLLPWSGVGYAFGDGIENGSESRSGEGGLNQLYLGLAWNPVGGLSIGANIGYLFGSVTNQAYAYTETGAYSLFQHELRVRDYHLDVGLQYTQRFDNGNRMVLGLTYSPKKNLHGKQTSLAYDVTQATKPDTAYYGRLNGDFSVPNSFGAGIAWHKGRTLMFEADFLYQDWKNAKFDEQGGWDNTTFDNRWRAAVGMQWQPDYRGSYGKRINYRLGAYFNHDYLTVRGNNVREYGVTCGVGLPVPGFKTTINIGVQYVHRQAHPTPLVKEDYLNLTIGINFNEMWFWRNKLR